MGQKEKLYKKLANCQKNVPFTDLCGLAEWVGFCFARQEGSHRIYTHEEYPGIMNFQDCKGQAKPLQVKQLLAFISEHDLLKKGAKDA